MPYPPLAALDTRISGVIYRDYEAERVAYAAWEKENAPKQIKTSLPYSPCSCVSYIRYKTGYTESVGLAKYWPHPDLFPTLHGVVVTNESAIGHVAFIEGFDGNFMILSETNFINCRYTYGRRLKIDSDVITGYWRPISSF